MDSEQHECVRDQSIPLLAYRDRRPPTTTLDASNEAPAPTNAEIPLVVIRVRAATLIQRWFRRWLVHRRAVKRARVYRLVQAEAELRTRLTTLDAHMTRRLGHLQLLQDGGDAGGLALEWELRCIKTIQRWWRRVRRQRAHEPRKRVEKPVVDALPAVVVDQARVDEYVRALDETLTPAPSTRRELPAENLRELRILRRMYQTQYRLLTDGSAVSDRQAHGKTFAELVPQYRRAAARYQRERDKMRELVEVAKTGLTSTYSVWQHNQDITETHTLFVQARDLNCVERHAVLTTTVDRRPRFV
ncbi:hypothetical protein AMAG_15683 [Allomyces macrogynus ATCC 38327]|uniref:Uncharacterized protein n=1 Tax=Allomyces macrogynus (strain ATCC 38327) TaxID=578462 RepID=A0A0L0T9M7_ALLM3|nr:hypothetical protein AMAG_15683 [Allomyces macrogynus ATCC 38327]|eukprot:KNE71452.1 hypothetical protein AMAG_15683 [Allomyces macrogynus ATCC 38327]